MQRASLHWIDYESVVLTVTLPLIVLVEGLLG